jgi:cysteine desulfurase
MDLIYADYAATTPLDPNVLAAMMPYMTDVFYNATSAHAGGLQAQQAVMKARMDIARHIGAKMSEIVFTSGATEAINLAILGLARKDATRRRIITVASEHAAVLDAASYCADHGCDVVFVGVDRNGRVDLDELRAMVNDQTLLVSVMVVNNETGVIQDIKAISDIAHAAGALFMTDATQGYGKIPLNVDEMGIDLMTFSGHKIYGPKGVGALYRRAHKDRTVDIEPMQYGGGQEGGVRSGTQNVPGIVGLAEAGNLACAHLEEESARIRSLRDRFERMLAVKCGAVVNGADAPRGYNISSVTFPQTDVNAMILNMPTVACSKGSACSSTKAKPSHVLTAMGRTADEADRTIRFSFGRFTTEADIDQLIDKVVTNAL